MKNARLSSRPTVMYNSDWIEEVIFSVDFVYLTGCAVFGVCVAEATMWVVAACWCREAHDRVLYCWVLLPFTVPFFSPSSSSTNLPCAAAYVVVCYLVWPAGRLVMCGTHELIPSAILSHTIFACCSCSSSKEHSLNGKSVQQVESVGRYDAQVFNTTHTIH